MDDDAYRQEGWSSASSDQSSVGGGDDEGGGSRGGDGREATGEADEGKETSVAGGPDDSSSDSGGSSGGYDPRPWSERFPDLHRQISAAIHRLGRCSGLARPQSPVFRSRYRSRLGSNGLKGYMLVPKLN